MLRDRKVKTSVGSGVMLQFAPPYISGGVYVMESGYGGQT